MNNEFESLVKIIKNIKLSSDEKVSMRNSILEDTHLHQIEQVRYAPKWSFSRINYYQDLKNYYFMINKKNLMPTLVIAGIIVITGGASVFAEKSIPGDALYGVKVSVNEPIAGVFAFTKEEKTEWQERLVERRLAEVQKLVSKNSLTEKTRVELGDKIKNQIDQFSTNVKELALRNGQSITSSDLNIRLQASLDAYQNVLATLSLKPETGADTKQETEKLLADLEESSNKVKQDHQGLELNVGVDSKNVATAPTTPSTTSSINTGNDLNAAQDKQTAAQNLLNSIKLSYQKEKVNLSTNLQTQIDGKLATAETALADGKALVTSSNFTNAIDKFQTVINEVNGAKLLMLSNVIKSNIEDDMGIDGDGNDIEESDESLEGHRNGQNSSSLETINPQNEDRKSGHEIEQEDD